MKLLFFYGHGILPIIIRLFTIKKKQPWESVPAHVAIVIGNIEYEAVVTGVRKTLFNHRETLNGLCYEVDIPQCNELKAKQYLDAVIGQRYGFETVAITGLFKLGLRNAKKAWRFLKGGKGGRTAPLHCSLLAYNALLESGVQMPNYDDKLPPSPNDLLLFLRELK